VKYLSSWFFLDLISVIPLDSLYESGNVNKVARFSRLGKVYKLVRMTKLTRLIKIMKVKNNVLKQFVDILKIGAGFERIVFLLINFFILQHVTACLW
jgi:hypothetical protein